MTRKPGILGAVGEPALLLPNAIREALAANDRLKQDFTQLQDAKARVLQTTPPRATVVVGRAGCSTTHDEPSATPRGSVAPAATVPTERQFKAAFIDDLETMLRPLELAPTGSVPADRYRSRLSAFAGLFERWDGELIPLRDVDEITRVTGDRDSVHRLVMDHAADESNEASATTH